MQAITSTAARLAFVADAAVACAAWGAPAVVQPVAPWPWQSFACPPMQVAAGAAAWPCAGHLLLGSVEPSVLAPPPGLEARASVPVKRPSGAPGAPEPLRLAECLGVCGPPSPASSVGLAADEDEVDAFIFNLTLRIADGAQLGLIFSPSPVGGRCLRIDGVSPGSAVEAWNRQCGSSGSAERVLHTGDLIVGANNAAGTVEAILTEIQASRLLRLQVVRRGLTCRGGASGYSTALPTPGGCSDVGTLATPVSVGSSSLTSGRSQSPVRPCAADAAGTAAAAATSDDEGAELAESTAGGRSHRGRRGRRGARAGRASRGER